MRPRTKSVAEAGSGVGAGTPAYKVNESASAPLPHVHEYVPGVMPRVDRVVESQVAVPNNAVPET
jgi:hypothetical protein